MSHTYNLSHAYLSHTPHCKAPYISGLIEGDRVAIDIETDSRQDAWLRISLWLTALSHAIKHYQSGNRPSCRTIIIHVTQSLADHL